MWLSGPGSAGGKVGAMTLPIDFRELQLLILFIFAMVGIMRGWYREGITSLFVAVLGILAWQPEVGQRIINFINDLIRFILIFVRSGFSFDLSRLSAQVVSPSELLDPDSYRFWMWVTVIMVVVSYVIGETSQAKLTGLGRVLGGVLGVANGFVLLSLARQYLTDYWRSQGLIVAASGPVTVQLNNVPAGDLAGGYGIVFVLAIPVAVIVLLIAQDRFKWPLR
jgi:hypothetical protein